MLAATLPDDDWIREVGAVPGVELRAWAMTEDRTAPEVGFVVHPYLSDPARIARVGSLGRDAGHPPVTVQLMTAGFDGALAHLPEGAALCNAAGVHDASTAEHTVALILASLRGIPEFVLAQERAHWLPGRLWPALADRRVLVVGYGRIGRAIAARLKPFEVSLTAVASSARAGDELVERVHGLDELPALLPEHDVVVLVVPLTDRTRRMVDADFLAAMPEGALLVNVARGPVVDTDALVAAARSGRVRAALDVTDPEPLPPDHPLWSVPGVLVAPHVGGATEAFRPRMVRLLREQLRRYAAGEPPLHVVAGPSH